MTTLLDLLNVLFYYTGQTAPPGCAQGTRSVPNNYKYSIITIKLVSYSRINNLLREIIPFSYCSREEMF